MRGSRRRYSDFLLRYSDSELGGVSLASKVITHNQHEPQVPSLYPFTAKDLTQRSIANWIFDINDLTFLYPSISKQVFRPYTGCTAVGEHKDGVATGYVKHIVKCHVHHCQMSNTSLGHLAPKVTETMNAVKTNVRSSSEDGKNTTIW